MNKTEMIVALAERTGLQKRDAEKALTGLLDLLTENLVKGEKVQLVGFGTFEVKERAARTARNPRTGESLEVAASRAPVFKAGKSLKDAVKK